MVNFAVPEVQYYADQLAVGPVIKLNNDSGNLTIEITSSEWDEKAGTGIVTCGFEWSTDNGKTWKLLVSFRTNIGQRGLRGMPRMTYNAKDKIKGVRVRPFVLTTADIKLGFVGTWA